MRKKNPISSHQMSDTLQTVRLHIGNISNKLAEDPDNLSKRLARFGNVVSPLELHTKPVNDHHFGFLTMELSDKGYNNLIKTLNNVQFMGLKLKIEKAKSNFTEAWKKDAERLHYNVPKDRVHAERNNRIAEYTTPVHTNPITKTTTAMSISPGYNKSAHVYMDKSANTKQTAPTHTLMGRKSYGSLTKPTKFYQQEHAMTSGGGEIIRGRIRKTPRSKEKFKNQTLRILINGELRQIKAYKTKLWGYEKTKTVNDLTWTYSDGVWKSGDDHILERVDRCGINGVQAANYGKDIEMEDSNEPVQKEEKLKSLAVLASMFETYDFDKPAELEDEDDEEVIIDQKGRKKVVRFDYEAEGGLESNGDLKLDNANIDLIESYMSQQGAPKQEVYYDEDDEGNQLDFDKLGQQYSTENISKEYAEPHQETEESTEAEEAKAEESEEVKAVEVAAEKEQEAAEKEEDAEESEESDKEFMPTFGAPTDNSTVNNTEALRTLFNSQSNEFSLGVQDDDIDTSKQVDATEQQKVLELIKSQQEETNPETESSSFGLFWNHPDSAFLQTQTQLSKLGYFNQKVQLSGEEFQQTDETPYEQWFWKMRGDVTRECKRRRRDVIRVLKKKPKHVA